MNINYYTLVDALRKMDSNSYSGEKLVSTEISLHNEDIENGKLGDVLTIKTTITKIDKYNNNKETTQVKILEIPAETEGLGKKFKITTQTVEDYEIDPKD